MKAIVVDNGALQWRDAPTPTIKAGEILIRNHATAINRADLAQRAGAYPPPSGASSILGLECAGEVIAVADDVSTHRVGDRVCALLAGGGYAEVVNVPAGQALPMPRGLSFAEAAALPEVFATAYLNLFTEARLARGESVLLHAGASGVGTAGIQLCRMNASPCFVTAGSDDKVAACVALGADGGINYKTQDFVAEVKAATGGKGADVVLDMVAGEYVARELQCVADDGRIVIIAVQGGIKSEFNAGLVLRKRLTITGSTLRPRPIAFKQAIAQACLKTVWPLLESGRIKPVIHSTFPAVDATDATGSGAARAHALMESNQHIGKIVLTWSAA